MSYPTIIYFFVPHDRDYSVWTDGCEIESGIPAMVKKALDENEIPEHWFSVKVYGKMYTRTDLNRIVQENVH